MIYFFPIVEGHGEERAVPALIRRALANRFNWYECIVLSAYRLPRGRITRPEHLQPVIELAQLKINEHLQAPQDKGIILIVLDADDECPLAINSSISANHASRSAAIAIRVVVANREYEAWLLAAADSFNGNVDCVDNIPSFPEPEEVRDAKGVFEKQVLKEGRYYSPTVDQEKYSTMIDFSLNPELRSRSLRRFLSVMAAAISNQDAET